MIEDLISYKEAAPVLCTHASCHLHTVTESSLFSRTKERAGLVDFYLDFAVNDSLLALWPLAFCRITCIANQQKPPVLMGWSQVSLSPQWVLVPQRGMFTELL